MTLSLHSKLIFCSINDFSAANIKKFDCGSNDLTNYFRRFAKKNDKLGLSPCTVVVTEGSPDVILGYCTVSNASIEKKDLSLSISKSLPNYPVPVTLLGRLAIAKQFHGQGIGQILLMHIFYNFYKATKELHLGSVGVVVDAINDGAVKFYQKYDFEVLEGQKEFPKRMFIHRETIYDALT